MNDATAETKRCTECTEVKPLTEFGRNVRAAGGLSYQCRDCRNQYQRRRHAGQVKKVWHEITCGMCGKSKKSLHPSVKWCSRACQTQAAEDRRAAKVAQAPLRTCAACGVTQVTYRWGRAVCDACKVDRRPARQEYDRKRTLTRHGITQDDWDAMLARQGGVCAICQADDPAGRGRLWHIDHDHAHCPGPNGCAECFRGLLCHNCNVGLGNFKDDPALLARGIRYLT